MGGDGAILDDGSLGDGAVPEDMPPADPCADPFGPSVTLEALPSCTDGRAPPPSFADFPGLQLIGP